MRCGTKFTWKKYFHADVGLEAGGMEGMGEGVNVGVKVITAEGDFKCLCEMMELQCEFRYKFVQE